jgi:hypothetical protein
MSPGSTSAPSAVAIRIAPVRAAAIAEFERKRRSASPLWRCDNDGMLSTPEKTHADVPPLDMSRWRMDGRLSKLVARRLDMDSDEALRFALACGGDLAATEGPEPFDRHLRTVISRYGLTGLFRDAGPGRHHHAIKRMPRQEV